MSAASLKHTLKCSYNDFKQSNQAIDLKAILMFIRILKCFWKIFKKKNGKGNGSAIFHIKKIDLKK